MRKLLLRAGLALAATGLAVCAAEAWVRYADPFGVSYYRDMELWKGHAIAFVGTHPPDPAGRIFQHLPGVDVEFRNSRLCTDALGLRSAAPGAPPRILPPEEALTVLCLGDSTTLCWGVDHADTWEVGLERDALATDGRPLVVHNAGHNIYDTVQEADLLAVLGPVLRPELVLVMFNSNDLDPTILVYERIIALAADPPTGLERLRAIAESHLKRVFHGLTALLHYREQTRLIERASTAPGAAIDQLPFYPEHWPRTEAAFELLRTRCAELGATLVVLDNGDPRIPDLRDWCARAGVAWVDTGWTAAERELDVFNSPADPHANAFGNRIKADKILAGLREAGLIAEADADPEFLHERAADEAARAEEATPRGLYVARCAACHGEEGRGDGALATTLDRPPRDFSLGATAFGDTPEALFKTISEGLGGSNPMPGFEAVLTEAEIRRVVEHVRTLMPRSAPRTVEAGEVLVGAEAVLVRGYLPPLGSRVDPIPRGLAIGLPGGAAFLVDAEDLQPLAMLAGRFVARTDWEGRGGTPLELLGELVHVESAVAAPRFALVRADSSETRLSVRPSAVQTHGPSIVLEYELRDVSGLLWAAVREQLSARSTSLGPVYERRIELLGAHELAELRHELLRAEGTAPWAPARELAGGRASGNTRADGTWLFVHVDLSGGGELELEGGALAVTGGIAHHFDRTTTIRIAALPDAEQQTLEALSRELFP